jgi:hypothetical protein
VLEEQGMGLFNKRKLSKETHSWSFLSNNGETLLFDTTFNLPLRDVMILQKCLEFYNDPDPCYIHRGAVTARVYFELEEAAEQLPKGEQLSVNNLPRGVLDYLELPVTTDSIVIT